MMGLPDGKELMYNLFVASNQELSCQAAPTSGWSKYTYRSLQLYSSSPNSARPTLELRYSFLHLSVFHSPNSSQTCTTHLSIAHCMVAYPAISGGMKYRTWFRERRTTFQKPLPMKVAMGRCLLGLSE
jgi:hypothetical protein